MMMVDSATLFSVTFCELEVETALWLGSGWWKVQRKIQEMAALIDQMSVVLSEHRPVEC